MNYEGRARLGDDDHGPEVLVRIANVEDPNWLAVILGDEPPGSRRGEVTVTLVDRGIYEDWCGTAILSRSRDDRLRLLGHAPLTPPVGA
jgi:hypothetical protein